MTNPSPPPQYSPDGQWWWDGDAWQPVPPQPAAPAAVTVAPTVAIGTGQRRHLRRIVGVVAFALVVALLGLAWPGWFRGPSGIHSARCEKIRDSARGYQEESDRWHDKDQASVTQGDFASGFGNLATTLLRSKVSVVRGTPECFTASERDEAQAEAARLGM